MTEKNIPSKKIVPEGVIIHGRIQVKESRRPVPDLLVQVFWVNPAGLKGANKSWYKYHEKNNVVRFAGEEITNTSGAFSLSLYMKNVLGDQPTIGMVILTQDDDESENPKPVYISPVPRTIVNRRKFLINIPAKRLETAGQLLPKPPTATEVLDRAEGRTREISVWLKTDQKKRDDSVKKIIDQARKAFKNFRPSAVPESVRKHDNYLEDRGKLKETLKKIREKNLKQLKDSDNIKTRRVIISRDKAAELGLNNENKTIKISLEKVTKILESAQHAGETALHATLMDMKLRQEHDQRIVETLYDHFVQKNQEKQ